jgi:hypothetical protein
LLVAGAPSKLATTAASPDDVTTQSAKLNPALKQATERLQKADNKL